MSSPKHEATTRAATVENLFPRSGNGITTHQAATECDNLVVGGQLPEGDFDGGLGACDHPELDARCQRVPKKGLEVEAVFTEIRRNCAVNHARPRRAARRGRVEMKA